MAVTFSGSRGVFLCFWPLRVRGQGSPPTAACSWQHGSIVPLTPWPVMSPTPHRPGLCALYRVSLQTTCPPPRGQQHPDPHRVHPDPHRVPGGPRRALFCCVLLCSVLLCSAVFCCVLLCSAVFCSVLFCSVLFCSVLFCSVLFCSALFCS